MLVIKLVTTELIRHVFDCLQLTRFRLRYISIKYLFSVFFFLCFENRVGLHQSGIHCTIILIGYVDVYDSYCVRIQFSTYIMCVWMLEKHSLHIIAHQSSRRMNWIIESWKWNILCAYPNREQCERHPYHLPITDWYKME